MTYKCFNTCVVKGSYRYLFIYLVNDVILIKMKGNVLHICYLPVLPQSKAG